MTDPNETSLDVAFCHLDLGLGGAERFIVDSALELQEMGHNVHVYTSHYDPQRCLEDTKRLNIHTVGTWIPRTVLGLFTVMCAWARMTAIALHLAWLSGVKKTKFDTIIVDQVSFIVPLLKWFTSARVVFYGHYPDLHLARRSSPLRSIYRAPFDYLEGTTTSAADTLLVNSNFTRDVYQKTFPFLEKPRVLYPTVAIPTDEELEHNSSSWEKELEEDLVNWLRGGSVLVSLNRFERKKNIALALRALREVIDRHALSVGACVRARLVVAGGYDPRVRENVQHYRELVALAEELDLESRVVFMRNVTEAQRVALISCCNALVYTPSEEHFGIVPLEAAARGCPVIAAASGGPLETVVHRRTGFLCEPSAIEFANAIVILLTLKPDAAREMRRAARQRMVDTFSRRTFAAQWREVLEATQRGKDK